MERKRCACEFKEVAPCVKHCACSEPFMSRVCRRCARYGSPEQQLSAAKAIVERETNVIHLLKAIDDMVNAIDLVRQLDPSKVRHVIAIRKGLR